MQRLHYISVLITMLFYKMHLMFQITDHLYNLLFFQNRSTSFNTVREVSSFVFFIYGSTWRTIFRYFSKKSIRAGMSGMLRFWSVPFLQSFEVVVFLQNFFHIRKCFIESIRIHFLDILTIHPTKFRTSNTAGDLLI